MKRKLFLIGLAQLFFGQILFAQSKPSPPNIIVITTDEQSADAISYFMGNQWIHTPAMDQIASSGIAFTNAYSANPICAPSRNSMITGLYPHQTGIIANDDLTGFDLKKPKHYWTGKEFKSIGTYFKEAGYETAYFGKWHLNYDQKDTASCGFAAVGFISPRGKDDSLPELADHFLKSTHKKPFLLFLSFLNPHDVCEWARFQKLPNGGISPVPSASSLPPLKYNLLPPKNESDAMTLMRKSYHNSRLFPVGNYTDEEWRRLAWGYYRLIEKVDSLIGRVFTSIKENGYDKNTLIVFTSDHGESLGAHGFNQKTVFYDESAKVPLILSYAGRIKPGKNTSLVNTGVDLLPSLLNFAGISIPSGLPGRSLKDAAEKDQCLNNRDYIVVENQMDQGGPVNGKTPVLNGRMVRSKRYKYCLYDIGKQREELFDLENDPGEMVNITTNKSSGKILREHRHYLEEFAEKNNDNLALQMLEYVKKERN
jgi:arylsulfatase A-like enzyme